MKAECHERQIEPSGAAAIFLGFADAEFGGAADVEEAFLAEGLEETVEDPHPSPLPKGEGIEAALFVARDVGGGPVDESLEAGFAVGCFGNWGHAESIHNRIRKTSRIA